MNVSVQPPLAATRPSPTRCDVVRVPAEVTRGEAGICVTTVPARLGGVLFEVYATIAARPAGGSTSVRVLKPGQIFRSLARPTIPSGRRDVAGSRV
jgi:hypothetical protein